MKSNWIKPKRAAMRAVLPDAGVYAGKRLAGALLDATTVIEKTTGRVVVQLRVYGTTSGNGVTLSVYPTHAQFSIHGTGRARGHGYHRPSSAMQDAMDSAGIKLTGDAYNDDRSKVDWARIVQIGGCGERSMTDAMLAIAYAAGARSVVIV